jgi:endonuclease/exonuclease/phosphatase family metal-dependent hydrolase
LNRKLLLTLLLGRPKGFPLQYATWNVRRSETSELAGPYLEVGDDAIGTYLASLGADVIALQEAWNEAKVESVVLAANAARAAASSPLPPLVAHGPVNHESTTIRDIIEEIGGQFIGTDGSSGGLYTLTSLPVAKSGFHAFSFDNCKGEDCLKAKGVQWTRILLNPPNPANSTCLVTAASRICPAPPSGGEYIDVFNLHLQASKPSLCSDKTMMKPIAAKLLAITIPDPVNMPWLVTAVDTLMLLTQSEFNCSQSDRKIRAAQLAEANAFIDQVTGDRKDRPVVIMGDFNIDGRTLGAEYASMLKLLRIGPTASTSDDWINPWRYDYLWDFDHGDVAREFVTSWPKGGACMGTFLWGLPMPTVDCPNGGNVEGLPPLGGQRFDYILLRPPYAIDDPTFVAAKWVAVKNSKKQWTSPYPGSGQVFGPGVSDPGPPTRLSDHKPVLVGIEHAKLQQPPKFHKWWKHDATFRVTSADASNEGDCFTCDPVDPMTLNYGSATDWSQNKTFLQYATKGSECENRSSVSWPAQSCMNNWSFKAKHDPALVTEHDYVAMLYDYDKTSKNDAMLVTEYLTWPLIAMEWTVPEVARTSLGDIAKDVPWPVYDTEPIPWYLGRYPTKMCLEVKTTELPPGQQ